MVTAALVKELREKTGAGMMDCKKVLTETDGDLEKAAELLREKGITKAAKKSGRVAAEGMVEAYISEDEKVGAIVEVNSETDFVAKNEEFRTFVMDVAKQIVKNNPESVEALLAEPAMFEEGKTEELLEFLLVYADSVETTDEKDNRSRNARELYRYLNNNKAGLLPYRKQGKKIPEPREGIVYKNMGVQESQNCTVITMRMKHRRMRWSVKGASNMAKVLCCKENKELCRTIEKYTDGLIFNARMNEIMETLSAAKTSKKDGKGNRYVELMRGHVPLIDAAATASRKAFRNAFIR